MWYDCTMNAIYFDSGVPEKKAKESFFFPECVMMENAAAALESAVSAQSPDCVLILCGTGNNGGDGYALSRRLFGSVKDILVVDFGLPKTSEAQIQRKMAESAGVQILPFDGTERLSAFVSGKKTLIADCIYGTGFHGELPPGVLSAVEWANKASAFRLACDIPSGIDRKGCIHSAAFCAHATVTMGALKTALFSDAARDFTGEISAAPLGISSSIFQNLSAPDAWLLEKADIRLPLRENKSAHKGNFGHAAVIAGEKPGAAVIAGTAALRFGAGLVTLVKAFDSGMNFMMQPELMISENFPEKTTAVLLGSGLGRKTDLQKFIQFIIGMKDPAAVLDADFFYAENLEEILHKLNDSKSRVILTPHPKELSELLKRTGIEGWDFEKVCENRFKCGRLFAEKFPNLTLIAKGACTYIYSEGKVYVCDRGTAALAKAGSGDVLAGLCTALLAQGYFPADAAKTAVFAHAEASRNFEMNFSCTPLTLIEKI